MKLQKEKTKVLTAGSIICWIVSVFLIINSLSLFSEGRTLTPFFHIIGGTLLLPPFDNYLNKKYNITLSGGLKIFIFILFVIILPLAAFKEEFNERSYEMRSTVSQENFLKLSVTSVSPFTDSTVEVLGEVMNNGTRSEGKVKVVSSCYDKDKRLVGTSSTHTEYYVEPNDKAPFRDFVSVSIPPRQVEYCGARIVN